MKLRKTGKRIYTKSETKYDYHYLFKIFSCIINLFISREVLSYAVGCHMFQSTVFNFLVAFMDGYRLYSGINKMSIFSSNKSPIIYHYLHIKYKVSYHFVHIDEPVCLSRFSQGRRSCAFSRGLTPCCNNDCSATLFGRFLSVDFCQV